MEPQETEWLKKRGGGQKYFQDAWEVAQTSDDDIASNISSFLFSYTEHRISMQVTLKYLLNSTGNIRY